MTPYFRYNCNERFSKCLSFFASERVHVCVCVCVCVCECVTGILFCSLSFKKPIAWKSLHILKHTWTTWFLRADHSILMLNCNSFVILWLVPYVVSDFLTGMNTLIATSLDTSLMMLVGEISRSGSAESRGVHIFKAFDIYCQNSFQKDCTNLYAASSMWHYPVNFYQVWTGVTSKKPKVSPIWLVNFVSHCFSISSMTD